MRIMVDTNVLISSFVFKSNAMTSMFYKITQSHQLVISSYVLNELKTVVKRKFPKHVADLDKFLTKLSFELVYSPESVENVSLFKIRDSNDYMVLYSAILDDADILITGDKDFADIDIEKPEILTPSEFLEKY
jgi:putative PIN family toxin of toxin-antitoxin system